MSEQDQGSPNDVRKGFTRRDLLKTSGAVAAGGLAAGLAPKASRAFAAPAVLQGAPLKLKYMTWFWWEPGRQDAWRYIVKKFNDSQKDIQVAEAGWPFTQYTDNILVQLQSGAIDADVIQTTPDLAVRLLKANQLDPVEDIIKKLGITTLSKAHDFITADGHLYGLDVVTVTFGLLYNQQVFQQSGITDMPTTVDQWIDATTRLTKRPDQFGIFAPHLLKEAADFWFILQEWAMPYDGIWAKGKTPLVTSDPVINGLKLFKKMYDVGMPQGTDGPTSLRMFSTGKIAQELIVSAAVNALKGTAPDIYPQLRSATLPWPSHRTITRIHPITVNTNGKNKDAAKRFIEFVYTPDNYRELLTRCLDVIPSYNVGGLDDYFKGLPWLSGYQNTSPITPPEIMGDFIFNNQEFGQIVLNHFQEVLTANKPVEEAMGAAQKELEDLAGRIG